MIPVAALRRAGDGAIRIHRVAVWLDRHRGRPPAIYSLRPAPHVRQRIADRRARRRGVTGSIRRCIFIVFGAGLIFMLRLMRRPPTRRETGPQAGLPVRSAGITPAGPAIAGTHAVMAARGVGRLIAFAVLAYVLLDGFDLGIGILFAVERRDEDRDVMVNSIAPVWDGNETWLVFGGGGSVRGVPAGLRGHHCPRCIRRSSPCCWRWYSAASRSSSASARRPPAGAHVVGPRVLAGSSSRHSARA